MHVQGMALLALAVGEPQLAGMKGGAENSSPVAQTVVVSVEKTNASVDGRRFVLSRGRSLNRQQRLNQRQSRTGGTGLFGNRTGSRFSIPRLNIPRFSMPKFSIPSISLSSLPRPNISLPSSETLMKPIVAYNNMSPLPKALLKTALPPLNVIDVVTAVRSQANSIQQVGNSGATLNASGVTQTLLR